MSAAQVFEASSGFLNAPLGGPPPQESTFAQAKALCGNSDVDSSLFFSDDVKDIARAKNICAQCVVRQACLNGALERLEPCGVWGGEVIINGFIQGTKKRRGRMPTPRPNATI